MKAILSVIQSVLFLISSFSVADSSFKEKTDMKALNISSEVDFGFDAITADEMKISDEEMQLCRNWYEKNILTETNPAYSFTVGGRKLGKNLKNWDIEIGKESETGAVHSGGKTTYITLTHKKSGLKATVEATIYEDFATCEWTVYIINTGDEKSPVIKNFHAADCTLETGKAELYVSEGSSPKAEDFQLHKSFVNSIPMKFTANGGRSGSFLPFFNLDGDSFGAAVSVGWTGQWFTSLQQTRKGVSIKAKQEEFRAYLEPGEEIRSPLVCVSFYKGGNPLKGFNTLRSWQTECVCPESIEPQNGFVIANEFSTLTADQLIEKIENIPAEILDKTDYFWMDAG